MLVVIKNKYILQNTTSVVTNESYDMSVIQSGRMSLQHSASTTEHAAIRKQNKNNRVHTLCIAYARIAMHTSVQYILSTLLLFQRPWMDSPIRLYLITSKYSGTAPGFKHVPLHFRAKQNNDLCLRKCTWKHGLGLRLGFWGQITKL